MICLGNSNLHVEKKVVMQYLPGTIMTNRKENAL